MTVSLSVEGERGARALGRPIRRRAQRMLEALGLADLEVSLALVDDATIAALNAKWRKKAKPTDVLSFPLHERPLSGLPDGACLGDVIVSVPTAARQAVRAKRSLLDEVTMLVAHGLLHLVGFDHGTDDQEREMNAYTRVLEAAATNKRPLALMLGPRVLSLQKARK